MKTWDPGPKPPTPKGSVFSRTVYIASDGKIFDSLQEAGHYEQAMAIVKILWGLTSKDDHAVESIKIIAGMLRKGVVITLPERYKGKEPV